MVRVVLAAELWLEYLEFLVLQKGCVNVHHSAANVLAKVKIKNQMRVALTSTPDLPLFRILMFVIVLGIIENLERHGVIRAAASTS